MNLSGRTLAILESVTVAALIPAGDVLLQALSSSAGFAAIDYRQVLAAALVGGLTYLIGFLRGLPILPPGTITTVTLPVQANQPASVPPTPAA